MKKVLSGVIAGAFVFTVGLAAQSLPAPSSPAAPAPSVQVPDLPSPTGTSGREEQARSPGSLSQAAGMMTIGGCIENAPPIASASASAGGGANQPAAGASASVGTSGQQRFILANAKPGASGSATAVGTAGTATATRYELDGQSAELTKHLNHQVEITGTVQPASASAAAGAAAAAPKLMVSSVKMVSATCTK